MRCRSYARETGTPTGTVACRAIRCRRVCSYFSVQEMDDLDDLLNLGQEEEASEDSTVYLRETPTGPRVDFEIRERTNFNKAYPETIREFRSSNPLPCGHQVSKVNPFGGYCRGRRFFRVCGKEYCSLCGVQCSKCGISVSLLCCGTPYPSRPDQFLCKKCRRSLKARNALKVLFRILIRPFKEPGDDFEEPIDDWEKNKPVEEEFPSRQRERTGRLFPPDTKWE